MLQIIFFRYFKAYSSKNLQTAFSISVRIANKIKASLTDIFSGFVFFSSTVSADILWFRMLFKLSWKICSSLQETCDAPILGDYDWFSSTLHGKNTNNFAVTSAPGKAQIMTPWQMEEIPTVI